MTLSFPLAALLLAAGVLIASCDSDNPASAGPGIEGLITIGPMCPVVQEDTPCPDQPYEAEVIVLDSDGDKVTTFESAVDGTFRVDLAPGAYTLEPQSPGALPFASPLDVEVRAGAYTHVDIQYDNGIR